VPTEVVANVVVAREPGSFFGWPANNGIWSWGDDEIVVGFKKGTYLAKENEHSVDRQQKQPLQTARSLDGGLTWTIEEPENYRGLEPVPLEQPIDFSHPDLAVQCWHHLFYVSYDRCRSWQGPYQFPDFGFASHTARTDYLVNGPRDCHFFLSANDPELGVQAGLPDRSFCVRTTDGGRTFKGFMLPENPEVRSVMSSTVRVSERKLVSALRRRFDRREADGKVAKLYWIDAAVSEDDGESWRFLSKVADTERSETQHNGNPPSLVRLRDGRLCTVYGFRSRPCGMRARISRDEGATWGEEVHLRDDGRTWDLGYPRSVVRPDGKIVSVYYYTTEELPEQHIAATIWEA
jgi:hypothetical protein